MKHPLAGVLAAGVVIAIGVVAPDAMAQESPPDPSSPFAPGPLRVTPTVLSATSIVGDFPEEEFVLRLAVDDPGEVGWRVRERSPWLTVSPLRGTIAGGRDSVRVALGPSTAPTAIGERRGLVVIGAADRPDVTVEVFWSVVEPPEAITSPGKPWYARPLVWVTAGALVAAGVVIAVTG